MKTFARDKVRSPRAGGGPLLVASFVLVVVGVLSARENSSELRFVTERPVDFVHAKGASGQRYLVETMGSGAALFDFDGDGDLDLYFVQGAPMPGAKRFDSRNCLYRNDGRGAFARLTGDHAAPDARYGMGCAVGDIDNDGDPDLFVSNYGRNSLYRNDGGRFVDITREAGVGDDAWASSAAFADFDGDGLLDLYVANYLAFTVDVHKECSLGKGIPAYCSPDAYPGVGDRMYRNLGGGKFLDVSDRVGLGKSLGKSLGVLCADFDRNGKIDVYIANDGVSNQLLMNSGDWKFEDATLVSATGYNDDGLAQAGMGVAGGDLDDDGLFDLFVTNLSSETNVLYRSLGDGFFEDATALAGVGPPSFLYTGFGTNAADFDADGDLDLFIANGHVIDNIAKFSDHQTYEQVDQVMVNIGNGRFRDDTVKSLGTQQPAAGRGSCVGDLDGDGDLDIVVTNCDSVPVVYRNQSSGVSWLAIELHGGRSNRDGVGARVRVHIGARVLERERYGGGSYLSAQDRPLYFGLGSAKSVDRVTVQWPSGTVSEVEVQGLNRCVVVEETATGAATTKPATSRPAKSDR